MSQEIDKRVVEMQFDNKQFEKNVQTSLNTIDKLKMALNFDGAKGLDSITQAAKKMDLSNITNQTERVQVSFSALQVAGMTMVSELTKSFMNFGKNLWNISFGQMKSGGMARSLKIEQADFKMKALVDKMDRFKDNAAGATQYIKEMGEAIDWAVTGTAYGYDSAASVAAQLMASGHDDVEQMRKDLRAVAGAAAMTGRSYDDMGRIFAAVAGQGRMMGDQLLQFSAGGINAAATIADYLGKSEKEVRDMVSKGQVDFQTFSDAMYDAYGEAAGKADETYAGVLSNVKAQLSRLGQRFAQPYIKNMIPFLQQLKASIKGISNVLSPIAERWDWIFGRFTEWGSEVLKNINVEKFSIIFRGIENLLWGIAGVLRVVKQAFNEVFPKKTVNQIIDAAYAFETFTEQILPSEEALAGLKGIFIALFTPLKIVLNTFSTLSKYVKPVVVALLRVVYAFTSIFQVLGPLALELLDFVDRMGILEAVLNVITKTVVYLVAAFEILVLVIAGVIKAFANSEKVKNFLFTLKDIALTITGYVVKALMYLVDVIDGVVNKFNNLDSGTSFFERLATNILILWELIKQLASAFMLWFDSFDSIKGLKSIINMLENLGGIIKDLVTGEDVTDHANGIKKSLTDLGNVAKEMGTKFKEAWEQINKGEVIMFAFAAVIIAVMLALKGLLDNVSSFVEEMTNIPALLSDIRTAIQNIGNFSGPAQAILAFTAAVAVVTNSLITLSKIEDQNRLRNAAIAIGSLSIIILGFVAAMQVLSKKVSPGEMVIDKTAIDILAITGSIMILVLAVKMLASLESDVKSIGIAVTAIITMMAALVGSIWIISKFIPEMTAGSTAFLTFAASMIILAKAVEILNNVPIDHITETIAALGTMMISFGLAVGLAGKASGWASLAIMTFTTSLIILFGMFMLLTVIPMEKIEDAVAKATEIFNAFIPLIIMIGVASRIAGGAGGKLGGNLWSVIIALTAFLGAFIGFAYFCASYDISEAMGWITIFVLEIGAFLAGLILLEGYVAKSATNSRNTLRNAMNASATFSSLSRVLVGMAAAILAIGVAAKLMDMVSPDSLKYLGIYLVIIGGVLLGLEAITAKNTRPPGKSLFNVIALLSGLGLVIAALIALQFADQEKLVIAAISLSICMLSLAMVVAAISSIPAGTITLAYKTALTFIPLLVAVGALVATVVAALYFTKDVPESTMKTFGISIGGLIGLIAIIISKFSKIPSANYMNVVKGIGSMALLTPLIGVLAFSIIKFANVPNGQVSKVAKLMLVMGVAIAALAGLVVLIAKNVSRNQLEKMLGVTLTLSIACLSFVEIAYAMKTMYNAIKGANADDIVASLGIMAVLFLEMSVILGILMGITAMGRIKATDILAIGASMTLMGLAFVELGSAFNIMKQSGASADEIKSYAIAFGILIAVMAGVGAILGFFQPAAVGFIALSVALVAVGSTVKMVGQGMLYLAEAIKMLGNVSTEEIDNVIDATKRFLDRFNEIADSFKKAWPSIAQTIAITMQGIGIIVGTFVGQLTAMCITAFAVAIAQNIDAILKAVSIILLAICEWLEQPETKSLITRVFADLADAAILGLSALLNIFPKWRELMDDIASLSDLEGDNWLDKLDNLNNGTAEGYIDSIKYLKELIADEWAKGPDERDEKAIQSYMESMHDIMQQYANHENMLGDNLIELGSKIGVASPLVSGTLLQVGAAEKTFNAATLSGDVYDQIGDMDEEVGMLVKEALNLSNATEDLTIKISENGRVIRETSVDANAASEQLDGYTSATENAAKTTSDFAESSREASNSAILATAGAADITDNFNYVSRTSKYTADNIRNSNNQFRVIHRTSGIVAEGLKQLGLALGMDDMQAQNLAESMGRTSIYIVNASKEFGLGGKRISDVSEEFSGGAESVATFGQAAQEVQSIVKLPIGPNINKKAFEELHNKIVGVDGSLKGITKLQDDVEPVKENLEDSEESLNNNETQFELTSDAANDFGLDLDKLGKKVMNFVEESDILSGAISTVKNGLGSTFGDQEIMGNKIGDLFKTSEDWRKEGSQVVGHVGYGPAFRNIQYWETLVDDEGKKLYSSLDDYVNKNSKFGANWFGADMDTDKMVEEATDYTNSLFDTSSAMDEVGDSADYAAEETDELSNSIEKSLDIFKEFNKEVKLTSREVLKNFYSQIDGVKTWQNELEALASRGFNQNFLKELADQGPEAYERVHALYTMTEQDLSLFNRMYAEKLVMQDNTADEIRQSFVEFGIMLEDEAELVGKDLGEKYDEAVAKAQAEAAKKKNGQMSDATKKRLAQMYADIEKYKADQDFIKKWYDSNAVIGETAGEAIATGMSDATTEGIIGTAAYIEAGKDMVEMIGKGIDKASPDILKGFENLGYASMETLKSSIEMEKVLTPVNEFRKGVYNQVKSSLKLFDEVKVKTDEELKKEQISTTQMLYNMNENLKSVGKWSYQLKQLAARGMSEGLVEELRQMGPEAADKVDAFARMSASELKTANRYYEESVQLTANIADRMTSEYAKQGFAVALGLKEGVDEGKDDLLAKMYEIGAESSEGFKKGIDPEAANTAMILLGNNSLLKLMEALDVHSPSRKTYDIGVNTILGLTNGIADPTANAELMATIADLGVKVKQAYDQATDEKYIRRPVSNLDNDIYQPVIRPMVDMSGVEMGIASFFANRQFSLSGTINNAFAAQRTGPSPDAIMITNAIDRLSNEQRAIRNDINNIRSDVSNLGNRIDGMRVVLDGNALVGELVAPLDKAMGNKVIKQKRGRM